MAASSPYQNNDYTALSTFRPYKLPINDIFKANVALNAYWDQGAANVKASYDNVLDLKLKTTDNKQIRDKFIQDSQKELTKVSTMNLADPTVQRMGKNIFSPIMKDENIVGEDYIIKNGLSELSTGEQFRTKDGGKYYNPLSVENIQFEQNLLSTDVNKGGLNKRDGWKAIAANQSKYTPFTDISKEYKQIEETVKQQELKTAHETNNGWMIETIEKKGVSKERMTAAIQEMGSPQLKAQIGVEARNVYYKKLAADPSTVDTYYQGLAQSYYDTHINDIKSEKAKLVYENLMTPKDSKDPQVRKNNQQYIKNNEEAIKTMDAKISTQEEEKLKYMSSMRGLGDPNNLSSNLGKIEQLWTQSSIDKMGETLSYQSSSQTFSANAAHIAQENLTLAYHHYNLDLMKESEIKRHNMADELHNQNMEQLDLLKIKAGKTKGKNADGTDADPDNENPTNNGSSTALPQVNDLNNPATVAALAEKGKAELFTGEAPIQEMTVKAVLGEDAWSRLQDGIPANKSMATVFSSFPDELTAASGMFRAFAQKHPGVAFNGKVLSPDLTDEQYKEFVGGLSVADFKQASGELTRFDSDFMADLVGKAAGTNGIQVAAKFRAGHNIALRDQINLSENINTKVAESLGDYKTLFPNGGKVNMTDENIKAAFKKGIRDNNLINYERIIITHPYTNSNIIKEQRVPATKAEYDKEKSGQQSGNGYVVASVPNLTQFTESVKKRTNPVYAKMVSESSQNMTKYTYDDKDIEKKTSDAGDLLGNIARSSTTDAHPEEDKLRDFILKNSKHIIQRFIINPATGESLPKVQFRMEGGWGGKDGSNIESMVDKVNAYQFSVTNMKPKFYTKAQDGYLRNPASKLVYAPFKGGTIDMVNYGSTKGVIVPRIHINGELKRIETGKKYTPNDIQELFAAKHDSHTIAEYMQTEDGINEVNTWLAGWITNLETNNKDYEKQQKK